MRTLWDRICCAIGMHAWWYEPVDPRGRMRWDHVVIRGASMPLHREGVRVCASCPAKQELVGGIWITA